MAAFLWHKATQLILVLTRSDVLAAGPSTSIMQDMAAVARDHAKAGAQAPATSLGRCSGPVHLIEAPQVFMFIIAMIAIFVCLIPNFLFVSSILRVRLCKIGQRDWVLGSRVCGLFKAAQACGAPETRSCQWTP